MIETVILTHLANNLDVPVYMEVPAEPPAEFVKIEKTGSSTENMIETATVAIQSYSDSMYHAAVLNDAVKTAMADIVINGEVASCRLQSDYNFTDTSTKHYRYQAVFSLTHY